MIATLDQTRLTAAAGGQEIEGGKGADLIIAGAGSSEIEADKGNDVVVDLGGSDKIDLGKGNDTLIYDAAANLGARDRADGGSGLDTLVLNLMRSEWFATALQSDVARLQAILAQASAHHDQDDGLGNLTFSAFNLSTKDFEAVRIFVDGTEVSLADNAVTAVADQAVVAEGGVVTGNVLTNDIAPDLVRQVDLVSGPATGGLTFNADGSFSFDATQGFDWLAVGQSQEVSFIYRVTDADGDTSEATVTITLTGTNDAPTISGTAAGAVVEDTTPTASGTLTGSDVDLGDVVAFSGSASSALGAFVIDAAGNWSYTLDPAASQALAAGQVVTEVFTVTATDAQGATATQDVTITLTGTNDAPAVTGTTTGAVDAAHATATGALTITDPDGDATSITTTAAPTYGSFAIGANGVWTYTLNTTGAAWQAVAAGSVVTDTATVQVSDGHGGVVSQTISIDVTGPTAPAPYAITPFTTAFAQADNLQATATGYIANGLVVTVPQPVSDIIISAPSLPQADQVNVAGTFTGAAWNAPTLHYTGGNYGDRLNLVNASGLALEVDMGGGADTTYLNLGQLADVVHLDGGAGSDLLYVVSNGPVPVQNTVVDFSQFLTTGQIVLGGQVTQTFGYESLFYVGSGNTVIGSAANDNMGDFGAGIYRMGAGDDQVSVYNSNFYAASSFYDMGDGNDRVTFAYGTQIGSGAVVDGGAGTDTVTFNNVSVMHAAAGSKVTLSGATVDLQNVENVVIYGDGGASDIQGTLSNDQIFGGAGDDTLGGLAGNDTIWGGAGNDRVLLGGQGSDVFVFNNGDGGDTVVAMDTASGVDHDVIEFHGVMDASGAQISDYASLMAHMIVSGGSVVFDFGGGNGIQLIGVDPATLSADDFLFS